ncbi:hypothetical protein CMI47_06850 [Candidatus Pacearchaeota archaeon]|nr:hypothetical protein [Candidatus Pacearchaeota archaeon]
MQENYKQDKQPVRHSLNFTHFRYVVNNCRVADEMEFMLMGYTKALILNKYEELEDGVTGTYYGVPFLASGTHVIDDEVWYWFVATPMVKDFFIRITREANQLIKRSMKKHPTKRHVVQVWSKHADSIKWLNTLKFKQFGSYTVGDEKIYLVERKRN